MSDVARQLTAPEIAILRRKKDIAAQAEQAMQRLAPLAAGYRDLCSFVCQGVPGLVVDLERGVVRTADGSDAPPMPEPEPKPRPRHAGESMSRRVDEFVRARQGVSDGADTDI